MKAFGLLSFCRSLLAGAARRALTNLASHRLQAGSYNRSPEARPATALHRLDLLAGLLFFTGCHAEGKLPDYQPLVALIFLETRPGEAGVPVQLPVSAVGITINAKPVFVEYDVLNAEVAMWTSARA